MIARGNLIPVIIRFQGIDSKYHRNVHAMGYFHNDWWKKKNNLLTESSLRLFEISWLLFRTFLSRIEKGETRIEKKSIDCVTVGKM